MIDTEEGKGVAVRRKKATGLIFKWIINLDEN